jgi:hypothetical protein
MIDQGRGSDILDPHIPRIPATMIAMEKVLPVLEPRREGQTHDEFSVQKLWSTSAVSTLCFYPDHMIMIHNIN